MATITETIEVGDGAQESLRQLLSRFPKGRRVRVMFTEEVGSDSAESVSLEDYRAQVAAARKAAPQSPWSTTEEALRELREAEED